jgi:anti-anti-sigma factor
VSLSRGAHSAGFLAPHDHACLFYRSEQDRCEALTAYALQSFARRARLVYAAGLPSRAAFVAHLSSAGIDVQRRREAGQLRLLSIDESYLANGALDPGAVVDLVRAEARAATREGWAGLAVAGDLGWLQENGCDGGSLVDYERQVHEIFAGTPATALCLYDHELLERETSSQLADVHPLCLRGGPSRGGVDWPLCLVERGHDGGLRLTGEVDLSNGDSVMRSMTAELRRRDTLVLDVSALSYIDVPTLERIWGLADQVAIRGGKLALLRPYGGVLRTLQLLGFEGLICEEDR